MNADVILQFPIKMSLIARHIAWNFDVTPYQEGSENEEDIVWNLKGFTHGIPEYA